MYILGYVVLELIMKKIWWFGNEFLRICELGAIIWFPWKKDLVSFGDTKGNTCSSLPCSGSFSQTQRERSLKWDDEDLERADNSHKQLPLPFLLSFGRQSRLNLRFAVGWLVGTRELWNLLKLCVGLRPMGWIEVHKVEFRYLRTVIVYHYHEPLITYDEDLDRCEFKGGERVLTNDGKFVFFIKK